MARSDYSNWLSDDEYSKLKFHTRAEIATIMDCFRQYGQSQIVDGAIPALMDIIEQSWMVVRGRDIPIQTDWKVYNADD